MTQNLPILIDQDGVIADFVTGLYRELELQLDLRLFELLPDPLKLTTFYIEDSVNTGDSRDDALLKEAIGDVVDRISFFHSLPMMQKADHYMHMLEAEAAKEKIKVVICTAPHVENHSCHSDKANWVRIHLGKTWAKHMIMTHDKTLVQGLVLVDDKPSVTGALSPTWQHVIFDACYNQGLPGPRVQGWNEQTVMAIMEHAVYANLMRP